MGYKEAGIEKYLFLATLDIKRSEICRKLGLKSFSVSEAEVGVNLPPMHPFCRSVTVPGTGSRKGTRWARDPITGKSITVPADMTYQQWYDKYVLKNAENHSKIKTGGTFLHTNGKLVYNPNATYNVNVEGIQKFVNTGLSKACREVAKLGYADKKEHLALVNLRTGKTVYTETGNNMSVGGSGFWHFVAEKNKKVMLLFIIIIRLHNSVRQTL